MKVIEHLAKTREPIISYEVMPPERGGHISQLFSVVSDVMKYNPPFIDVTSHAAEVEYLETPEGIRKRIKRKRPGTIGISVAIKNHFHIDTVPHLLCHGFTREETEDALIELNYLGIENVLAIRGDDLGYKKPIPDHKTENLYAYQLVQQITNMNKGNYLEKSLLDAAATDFCIGIAGYPEKHFESPNMTAEIYRVKQKVDEGAHYVVTQLFYNNKYFYDFVALCKKSGVNVPIIPGLKVITNKAQLVNIPKNFYINIPEELANEVNEAKPEHVLEIGARWSAKQVTDLFNNGISAVHFYIMQSARPIKKMFEFLKI
jgi:methylenetetrahydrofolate reductase (NADPH)